MKTMRLSITILASVCLNSWRAAAQATLITSTAPYYANGSYCTLAQDGLYRGYSTDRSLQCYCVTQLRNWLSTSDPATHTRSITRGIGATTMTITSAGSTYTTSQANLETEVYTVTGNGDTADDMYWYGSAEPPCCSSCTVAAQTVDLFYFPTPAVESAATSFESNGYTFESPSVYIGFTSLYAYDFCGTVGDVYVSTTIAFDPSEISTLGVPVPTTTTFTQVHNDWSAPDPNQLTTETDTWTDKVGLPTRIDFRDLNQDCSTISGYSFLASEPLTQLNTYDPCHPIVVLPSRVRALDPAWASCLDNAIRGFYDPPSALTAVTALIPVPTSSSPIETPQPVSEDPTTSPTTPSAAPASTPTPVLPDPTTTPPLPPASSSPNPPVQPNTAPADPSGPPAQSDPAPVDPTQPPAQSNPAPADPTTPAPIQTSAGSTTQPAGAVPANSAAPSDAQSQPVAAPPVSQGAPTPSVPAGQPVPGTSVIPEVAISIPTPGAVIASQTLKPGGPAITSAGVVFSAPTSGSSVIAIIGSSTLQPGGPAVTSSGVVFSIPTSGGSVVASAAPTESADPFIGSIILSIIGGGGGSTPSGISIIYPSATGGLSAGNSSTPTYEPASGASKSGFTYFVAGIMSLVGGIAVIL